MYRKSFLFLCSVLLALNCQSLKNTQKSTPPTHPEIQREFRAAWVATVDNINWPSSPGLPVTVQQEEALEILDLLADNNFNAVIFQVRPQADALYESELEPWSYYLTGEQGESPFPYYDPLEFWIDEAHKRGLELHVWLNPYRAHHPKGGIVSDNSLVNTKSHLVVELKNGYWWFDPSLKETQDHGIDVVMDIVKRYDIDGVHFDDYFYPYPSYNNDEDFPDDKSWNEYVENGGDISRGDWRRNSVNQFIEKIYTSIKKEKPFVKFGLSPFGIWRPGHPSSIQGFDQYDVLYADAKLWLNEGWIDYFSPQLYWPVNQVEQSFPVLLGWWNEQNYKNRHVWPGVSIGRFQGEKQADEVLNNIMITRGMNPEAPGLVHWSVAPLIGNDSLQAELKTKPYREKAVVPSLSWLKQKTPELPDVEYDFSEESVAVSINKAEAEISNWIVYYKYDDTWSERILNRKRKQLILPYTIEVQSESVDSLNAPQISLLQEIQVTYIDRFGFESKASIRNLDK
tara:strand:- start:141191 stop:142726 length:1536 start_codon:yes stop_codon:yes gene_type:complete